MLARIDAILRREQKTDEHKDQKFAELGKYEVRKQGYRRLGYKCFEGFPEAKFADSRRKAYYLMSTHDHLPRIPPPKSRTGVGRKPWSWQRWRGLKEDRLIVQPGCTRQSRR